MADNILKEARDAFREIDAKEKTNRADALADIKFARMSEQWPESIRKQRETDPAGPRPCLTINKLAPVIRQVVNDARQNRPAISVHPADDKADPETAEVIGGLIRNIEQSSNADVAYDTGVEHAVSGGFGYWSINLDYSMDISSADDLSSYGPSAFEQDIRINRVSNPFSVYGDPWSAQADSSDWNSAFVVEKVKKSVYKRKYPGAKLTDFSEAMWTGLETPWFTEDTVLVAAYWKREEVIKQAVAVEGGDDLVMLVEDFEKLLAELGPEMVKATTQPRPIKCHKVTQHLVSGVEELEKVDWKGKYIPIVPVYGDEVNVEGERYFRSLIRDAKDSNRMFNYWRTTATEVVALAPRAPFVGPKGAFKSDAAKWRTANSHSHAYIEFDGNVAPSREAFAGVPAGMIQEALNASDDIKAVTGIYDASLGQRSNETSGKAIMARQREGDISTYHFIDNLNRAIRHTGKILIDLIPKVYSTERIIRILGEDGKADTKPINQQYEKGKDQEGNSLMAIHDLRVGRYDLTVKAGPSFTSRREEAASQMIELIRAYPDAAPVIGDLLASNLDWPGADEIAKRLEKMLPPQLRDEETGNIPPEVQGQMQQMGEAIQQLGEMLKEANEKYKLEQQKIDIDREDKEGRRDIEWFKALTEAAAKDHAADQAEAKTGLEADRIGLEGMKTAHAANMAEQQMERSDIDAEHSRNMDQERFGFEREQAEQAAQASDPEGPTA